MARNDRNRCASAHHKHPERASAALIIYVRNACAERIYGCSINMICAARLAWPRMGSECLFFPRSRRAFMLCGEWWTHKQEARARTLISSDYLLWWWWWCYNIRELACVRFVRPNTESPCARARDPKEGTSSMVLHDDEICTLVCTELSGFHRVWTEAHIIRNYRGYLAKGCLDGLF